MVLLPLLCESSWLSTPRDPTPQQLGISENRLWLISLEKRQIYSHSNNQQQNFWVFLPDQLHIKEPILFSKQNCAKVNDKPLFGVCCLAIRPLNAPAESSDIFDF